MNKSMLIGSVFGAIAVTAGGAYAGYRVIGHNDTVPVVSATPINKTVRTPRQECHDVQVTRVKPAEDGRQIAGTGIGAVIGGLLGNRVGGGSGKVLATVAGAAAGGYAGNRIERRMQQGNTYTTSEQRCDTVYDITHETAGYEVVYVLDGKRHHVRLDHDPGSTLPLKDGRVVLASR